MKYRAEIDGLRSLAILPVVAFHAGIAGVSGGFTGVDVFFVISGYLITGIILSEIATDRFSIGEFYKRRILRILPALVLVLVATALGAWAIMLPNQFLATGRSIVATALFVSNIYFWQNSGYFAAASGVKPLLHTWSLAVEEQFYLFFPLFLLLVARFLRRRFVAAIGLVSLASFIAGILVLPRWPEAAFYLLPTRIWELGLGALIAAGGVPRIGARAASGAAVAGLGLLAWGIFALSEADPFPGWNALYPCLGAGLIIAYAAGTPVARLLGTAPLVYIGRISYSLYLWHWPVIVLARLHWGPEPTPLGIAAMIGMSVLLADLSWRFIERPFRTPGRRAMPVPRALWAGAASLMALLLLGGAIARTGAAWRHYPPEVLRIAAYTDYTKTADYEYQFDDKGGCRISGYHDGESFDPAKCLTRDPDRPNYLVLGDSHAGAVWRAISLAFPQVHFLRASSSGCRPLLDGEGEAPCLALENDIYRNFIPKAGLDGIILVGRWRRTDFPAVAPSLAWIKSYVPHVVIFGPTVEYLGEFPLLLASERLNGSQGLTAAALDPSKKALSDDLGRIVAGIGGMTYVPVYDALCPQGTCTEATPDDVPLQFDYGHLTLAGSKLLVDRVQDQMQLADLALAPAK